MDLDDRKKGINWGMIGAVLICAVVWAAFVYFVGWVL